MNIDDKKLNKKPPVKDLGDKKKWREQDYDEILEEQVKNISEAGFLEKLFLKITDFAFLFKVYVFLWYILPVFIDTAFAVFANHGPALFHPKCQDNLSVKIESFKNDTKSNTVICEMRYFARTNILKILLIKYLQDDGWFIQKLDDNKIIIRKIKNKFL